jgi:hypothetical protein
MAQLQSPGINVSIIDQSFYTPAGLGTVPLIFVATKSSKLNASSSGIARGTTLANTGKVYVITSQRDLVDTFGTPYFEIDSGKNAINGSEISEYGLQAAYSVLGITSRVYVVRADIDLDSLVGTSTIPQGHPVAGVFWLDTSSTRQFGINKWNASLNSNQGGFVNTPVDIIDDTNAAAVFRNGLPVGSFGMVGDYAMYLPNVNEGDLATLSQLFYKKSGGNGWEKVQDTFDNGKRLQISEHFNYPLFNASTATGSVWVCDTPINIGASWNLKYYNGNTGQWTKVNTPQYGSRQEAIAGLDPTGGGVSIAQNSTFVLYDYNSVNNADFRVMTRENTGPTTFSVTSATTYQASGNFYIRETSNTGTWKNPVAISISPTGTTPLGQAIATQIANSNFTELSAKYENGTLTFSHATGGELELADGTGTPLALLGLTQSAVQNGNFNNLYVAPSTDILNQNQNQNQITFQASNWAPLSYYSKPTPPNSYPAAGTLWYDTRATDVDILWNSGTSWVGYKNALSTTNPAGPFVQSSAPTKQSDGTDLVTGDIWIDRSMPDMYGQLIYVYNATIKQWVKQDVTDHVSPTGWVFADARWSDNGTDDMAYVTPITDLLVSNYLDFDAPDATLYPKGTRLWNTRRSGNTVKQYFENYVNINTTNPYSDLEDKSQSGYAPDRWVTVSGHNVHNVANFGRLAQRAMVVDALQSAVTANTSVRDTDTLNYNLIATPGYTELIPDMVALNQDIGQTAFVIGDTPLRLAPDATTLQNYGNGNGAVIDGEQGLISSDSYLGVYYPSGYTNDNNGRSIVVPPSHMMLRVIVNNDNVSYPWFAPAGTNRGIVNNASSVGYIDPMTAEFTPVSLYQGLRDVLSGVEINPIATLPGSGITVMGQYTRQGTSTALNRINVARLVNYIRRQLNILSKPFLFEPNDSQTRNEIKRVVEGLLHEILAQRGLYDYVVVCDTSNNTPTRIDQNQLWVDIAIEPVKAVEFIYIPLRLLNTGAIKSGNYGSAFPGTKNSSSGQ